MFGSVGVMEDSGVLATRAGLATAVPSGGPSGKNDHDNAAHLAGSVCSAWRHEFKPHGNRYRTFITVELELQLLQCGCT